MRVWRSVMLAGVVAVAAAACGGDEPERRAPTPAPAEPAATAATGPGGEFPDRPQVDLGAQSLDAGREPAPQAAEPATRPVYAISTVRSPKRLRGRAGVFCRGSGDGRSGYELTVDRRGRVELDRVQDGRRTLLAGYDKDLDAAVDPAQPLPVILVCGEGDERGVSLGVLVGAGQLTFIRDRRPLDPGPRGLTGLVAADGPAEFGALKIYFAR